MQMYINILEDHAKPCIDADYYIDDNAIFQLDGTPALTQSYRYCKEDPGMPQGNIRGRIQEYIMKHTGISFQPHLEGIIAAKCPHIE